jgi:hypothetical protein
MLEGVSHDMWHTFFVGMPQAMCACFWVFLIKYFC